MKGRRVVTDGHVVKADVIDTGAPLLKSRYEWRASYRRFLVRDLVVHALLLVVPLSVVALVLYAMLPDIRLGILVMALVMAAVLIPEVWATGFYDPDNPPGLYKEGLMHPRGFFLPYGELRDVEILYPSIPLMPTKVSPVPYFDQPSEDYTEWYFPAHILGDKGVEMLRAKVAEINEELGV